MERWRDGEWDIGRVVLSECSPTLARNHEKVCSNSWTVIHVAIRMLPMSRIRSRGYTLSSM